MTNPELAELLKKYLNDECNDAETAIINSWYAGHEHESDYLASASAAQQTRLKNNMLSYILTQVNVAQLNQPANQEEKKSMSVSFRWWFGLTAAAVLLVMVKFTFFNAHNVNRNINQANTQIHYTNNTNTIKKTTLPDGSVVWLKPGTSLIVPKVFAKASRNVTMNGECFFEVTKNPLRPFIISSKHIVTKVWGTSFKVVDYYNNKEAVVKVISGKVSVSKKTGDEISAKLTSNEVVLMPAQKVVYNEEKKNLETDLNTDMHDMNQWKHINLAFEDDKLSSIVKELNKRFSTNLTVPDDRLGNSEMTADFSGLNLPEVLEVLKASMKIDYEINSSQIILTKH